MNCSYLMGLFLLFALIAPQDAQALYNARFGPADDPERYSDYGGTPDVTLSRELGLTPGEVRDLLTVLGARDYEARLKAALDLKRYVAGSEESFREILWGSHGARNAQIRRSMNIARKKLVDAGQSAGGLLGELLKMNPSNEEAGQGTKAATRVMSILVALHNLNSLVGYKIMLDFSPRHAGVFRKEIGKMLVAKGFDTLPALIYGRGSKNDELHMFSVKWIKDMGNPLLGEQIRGIKNPRRLAQLMESYASVNDLNAIDVTLSMTNHESVFVRNAARQCLVSYGKNAKWQIRRMFENTFGAEPVDDSSFNDWLQELYLHFDKERNAKSMNVFQEGLNAKAAGDFNLMSEKFKAVLRKEPLFSQRYEMANGFIAHAELLEKEDRYVEAKEAVLIAARVAEPGSAEEISVSARLDWMAAEANRRGGAFDVELYRRVAKSDSEINTVVELAGDLMDDVTDNVDYTRKAVLVSLLLFFSALLTYLRVRG